MPVRGRRRADWRWRPLPGRASYRLERGAGVPDHPRRPGQRRAHREHRGPRIDVRAGRDAQHTTGVFVIGRAGPRPPVGDVGLIRDQRGRRAKVGPDAYIDQLHQPTASRPWPHHQARFQAAERHRDIGSYGLARHRSGGRVDAARGVHRDDRRPRQRRRGGKLSRIRPQSPAGTDADQPVEDHVRIRGDAAHHPRPPAALSALRPSLCARSGFSSTASTRAPRPASLAPA